MKKLRVSFESLSKFYLLLFLVSGVCGFFVDSSSSQLLSNTLCRPSIHHLFGCDAFGNDLGLRLLEGSSQTLVVVLIATATSSFFGLLLGILTAVVNARLQFLFNSIINIALSFPGLLLSIFISTIAPPTKVTLIGALVAGSWAPKARFANMISKSILGKPFIESVKASGGTLTRLITHHLIPTMLPIYSIQIVLSLSAMIIAESSLSFLGVGGAVTRSSWGQILNEGRNYLVEAPHLSLIPGILFLLTIFSLQFFAESLRKQPSIR